MFVRQDCRRYGIGRLLLQRVEDFAAEIGLGQVWVFTESAAEFYCRCGWVEVEHLDDLSPQRTVLTWKAAIGE